MEKKFSFVKHLTKRDVEKIIERIGLEIDTERTNRDGEQLNPILRGTGDDGRGYIIVFCIDRKQQELDNEMKKYLYENSQAFRDLTNTMLTLSAFTQGMGGGMSDYMMRDKVILRIDDFTVTESMSLKSEQEEIDFDLMMTGIYQKYMAEKFGRFYYNMKAGYIRTLNMQENKNSQAQKENETEAEAEEIEKM